MTLPPFTPSDPDVRPQIERAAVTVDCGAPIGPLDRIWTSFGYDEINWTYTPAGKRNLRVVGELAEQPYFVRPHYVFNSGIGWSLPHWGAGNVYHEDANGAPSYDFTVVDQAYDAIVGAGLKPLVELGFTPRALVPDDAESGFAFTRSPTQWSPYEAGLWSYPPKDYQKWGGLVRALVEHCVERYGADHVRTWLWELWNEPDITYWRGTVEQFCALYDVTAAAVKAALPDALVGGPTTTGDLGREQGGPHFLRQFLAHCARAGTPLDFVSFHTKGGRFSPWRVYGPIGGPAPEKQSPSMLKMLREVRASLAVMGGFPAFRALPAIVDECDASVPAHWGLYDNANFAYRNTEYYPVFQCKLMKKLLDLNAQSPARVAQATTWSFYFEGERYFEGTRSLFTAGGIEKPVLNAYRMLSRLGTIRLPVAASHAWTLDRLDNGEAGAPEEVDALAAFNGSDRVSLLVWRHADDQYLTDANGAAVDIVLERLPFEADRVRLRHWRVDRDHSNSHAAWQAAGAPQDPSEGRLHSIKDRQRLELFEPDRELAVETGRLSLQIGLPLPSASLLEIQARQPAPAR
jgi:xylan 1,4-beta-xylosidase